MNENFKEMLEISKELALLNQRYINCLTRLVSTEDEWLTPQQVADITGLSTSRVRRRISEGAYEINRISERRVLVKKSSIRTKVPAQIKQSKTTKVVGW